MSEKFSLALINAYLGKSRFDGRVFLSGKTVSTQTDAKKFIKEHGVKDAVFITDEQTAGYGRNDRLWMASAGKGLTFSVLTRTLTAPSKLPFANYAAALAVRDVLLKYGLRPELKWPNDILANGKKICGILSESAVIFDSVFYLITGFGLNVNQLVEDFPNELQSIATSLKIETGNDTCREKLTAQIIIEFVKFTALLQDSPDNFLSVYRNACSTIGKEIRIILDDGEITASAEDINSDGSLLVNKNGEKLSFFAADVIHLRNA